jgi:hypothetical protein
MVLIEFATQAKNSPVIFATVSRFKTLVKTPVVLCLEPERGIRCKRKGMCKISQLENYELSLMVKMKL